MIKIVNKSPSIPLPLFHPLFDYIPQMFFDNSIDTPYTRRVAVNYHIGPRVVDLIIACALPYRVDF